MFCRDPGRILIHGSLLQEPFLPLTTCARIQIYDFVSVVLVKEVGYQGGMEGHLHSGYLLVSAEDGPDRGH